MSHLMRRSNRSADSARCGKGPHGAAAWRAAGFVEIEEQQLSMRMEFADFDDYWRPYLGRDGPGAEHVRSISADEPSRLEAAVRSAYLDGEPDGPRSYAALAWAVKGKVPHATPGDA